MKNPIINNTSAFSVVHGSGFVFPYNTLEETAEHATQALGGKSQNPEIQLYLAHTRNAVNNCPELGLADHEIIIAIDASEPSARVKIIQGDLSKHLTSYLDVFFEKWELQDFAEHQPEENVRIAPDHYIKRLIDLMTGETITL